MSTWAAGKRAVQQRCAVQKGREAEHRSQHWTCRTSTWVARKEAAQNVLREGSGGWILNTETSYGHAAGVYLGGRAWLDQHNIEIMLSKGLDATDNTETSHGHDAGVYLGGRLWLDQCCIKAFIISLFTAPRSGLCAPAVCWLSVDCPPLSPGLGYGPPAALPGSGGRLGVLDTVSSSALPAASPSCMRTLATPMPCRLSCCPERLLPPTSLSASAVRVAGFQRPCWQVIHTAHMPPPLSMQPAVWLLAF